MVDIPLFTGFYASQVVNRIPEPSTVVALKKSRSVDVILDYLNIMEQSDWHLRSCAVLLRAEHHHLSQLAFHPRCLGYIGDYTTQLNGDYNKPL